ncbi:MAG TPA: DUF4178 domain-containing protein [Blastocatellia bacterium]
MSPIEISCPACGASVTFKIGSSIVTVCEFCQSVVARGDRRIEDLGKVAEVVDTGSPLDVGLRGVYQNVPFELTGRAQLGHAAGGIWDEWYAAFADGRWGWLAEAQGRLYMTFGHRLPGQTLIPPFDALRLGEPVAALSSSLPLLVVEKGAARTLGAKGEIPYRLVPGETFEYADLSGVGGAFATIDYSDSPPQVYVGREVTLLDLGLSGAPLIEREARRVAAAHLSCPRCGGPLELRAPDHTERVTCPNCGSLLDVNQGRLKFMKALTPGKVIPVIAIGAVGGFDGGPLTVIGFMQRSVEFEGVRYFWEEYLLYNPSIGFRWLVRSDDNWSFVQTVPPGEVIEHRRDKSRYSKGDKAEFRGESFKLYQDATGRVEHVQGEFYWKVTEGEQTRMADFIRPPRMLSKEESLFVHDQIEGRKKTSRTGEINWSLGTYVKPAEVERAFNLQTRLPRPAKVAPNQPFLQRRVYKYWLFLVLALIAVGVVMMAISPRRKVFEQTYQLQPLAGPEESQIIFSEQPLELASWQNVKITAEAPLIDNTWLQIQGDLIDDTTNLAQGYTLLVEYYHGVDGGESWSEGGRRNSVHVSSLPAGRYTLALDVTWEKWQQAQSLKILVEQGVPRILYLILAIVLISLFPIMIAIYHWGFEKRRWNDSDYSPYGSG